MLHFTLLILTLISLLTIGKTLAFSHLLRSTILLATNKEMLSFMEQDETYEKVMTITYKHLAIWKALLLPATIIQTINIIAAWWLLSNQYSLPEYYTIFTTLFTATLMSYVTTFNVSPPWLVNWLSYLTSIRKQVELDFLLTQLTLIKTQLINHQNGTNILPSDELTKIKQQGLFLAKITESYK